MQLKLYWFREFAMVGSLLWFVISQVMSICTFLLSYYESLPLGQGLITIRQLLGTPEIYAPLLHIWIYFAVLVIVEVQRLYKQVKLLVAFLL